MQALFFLRKEKRWLVEKMVKEEYYEKESIIVKLMAGITDPLGKQRTIYAKSLVTLRQKEDELVRDQMDGLNVYVAGSADVNFLFDRYISTKTELRSTTKANYLYT